MKTFDLIVIGAGPAGSSCAAFCARGGMNVLLLDSASFPRDKVCGDCLNPAVWPILDTLDISSRVKGLPKSSPKLLRFSASGLPSVEIPLPSNPGEIAIRRREFDALLVERARELGAVFQDDTTVTGLDKSPHYWEVIGSNGFIARAPQIVASDGRNSTVARQMGMLPPTVRDDRVGIQAHIPHPDGYDGALEMHLYDNGYGGLADLGEGTANLCLVSNAGAIGELKSEVVSRFDLPPSIHWRSISPISREPAREIARNGVFLSGDSARIVEPFTGEGIAFALRSGALLSDILISSSRALQENPESLYDKAHRELYRGKLAVNRLTKFLSQHPKIARLLVPQLFRFPSLLSWMASRVIE